MINIKDYQRHLTGDIGTIHSCITVMYKYTGIKLKSFLSVQYVQGFDKVELTKISVPSLTYKS